MSLPDLNNADKKTKKSDSDGQQSGTRANTALPDIPTEKKSSLPDLSSDNKNNVALPDVSESDSKKLSSDSSALPDLSDERPAGGLPAVPESPVDDRSDEKAESNDGTENNLSTSLPDLNSDLDSGSGGETPAHNEDNDVDEDNAVSSPALPDIPETANDENVEPNASLMDDYSINEDPDVEELSDDDDDVEPVTDSEHLNDHDSNVELEDPEEEGETKETDVESEEEEEEESPAKKKLSLKDKLASKIASVKQDIKSEMGKEKEDDKNTAETKLNADDDADEDSLSSIEDLDLDDEDLEDEEDDDEDLSDDKKEKGVISSVYGALHNAMFGLLLGILNPLSRIPFIGRLFRPIVEMTRLLEKLSHFLPVLIVVLVWVLVNIFYTSSDQDFEELPDESEMSVQNARYDQDQNIVTADITNSGSIIAETHAEFTVYSTQFGFHPKTWLFPQEVVQCKSDWSVIDIGETETVEATCGETEMQGFWFRTSVEEMY